MVSLGRYVDFVYTDTDGVLLYTEAFLNSTKNLHLHMSCICLKKMLNLIGHVLVPPKKSHIYIYIHTTRT